MIPSSSRSARPSRSSGGRLRSCLALSLALLLAAGGCAREPLVSVRTERILPPAALLTCAEAPVVPPRPRTQQQVALYLIELRAAHADCKAAVDEIARWADRPAQGED